MDFKTAADDVRKLTRYFESLNGIVAVLDSVASIDQARTEAQGRLQIVLAEHSNVEREIATAVDRLNEVNCRVDDAKALIEKHRAEATEQAGKIIAEAQAECDAERKRMAAQAMDAKRAENNALKNLNDLKRHTADAQTALDTINAQLEAARQIARTIAA